MSDAPRKLPRRTCEIPDRFPRVDVQHSDRIFKLAALRGAGGIMGYGDRWGYVNIPHRVRKLQAERAMLTIVLKIEAGRPEESFDVPAAECELLALYAPGYDGK